MKLFNIFKKETQKLTTAKVQSLSKNQLEKVIGGVDEIPPVIDEEEARGRSPKLKNSW